MKPRNHLYNRRGGIPEFKREIGFSTQEIEHLFPEIVQTDAGGIKAVDYSRLSPILVEALKDEHEEIKEQQREIMNEQKEIKT